MAESALDKMFIEIGLDAKELEAGLKQAAQLVANLQKGFEAAGEKIDAEVKKMSASSLLFGGVSDHVADRVLEIGSSAQKAALIAGRSFEAIRSKATLAVNGLTRILAPIAGAMAAGTVAANFSKQGEALAVLSDRLGVSVEKIDAWSKANRDAGGSAEAFQGALEDWVLNTGRGADEFFKLGEHVKGMTDVQAQYFLNAMGLSQESAAVFIKYKDAAKGAADAYASTAMTQEQAEAAQKVNIQWRRFTDQIQAVGNVLAMTLLPVVEKVLGVFSKGLQFLNEHSRGVKFILGTIAAFVGASFLPAIIGAVTAFVSMAKGIGLASAAMKVLNGVLMANPIGAAVAAAIALGLVLEDLWTWFQGGDSLFGSFFETLGKWIGIASDWIGNFFKSIVDGIANALYSAVEKVVNGVKKIVGGVKDAVSSFFGFGDDEEEGSNVKPRAKEADDAYRQLSEAAWMSELRGSGANEATAYRQAQWHAKREVEGFSDEERQSRIDAIRKDYESGEHRLMDASTYDALMSQYERANGGAAMKDAMRVENAGGARASIVERQVERGGGGSIQNDMQVQVTTTVSTTDDPQAVGEAVGNSVKRALSSSNRMLTQAQTGVVQKG